MPLKEGECKPEMSRVPQHKLTIDKDAWPSSAAFDAIASALSSDAERKDAIKKGGAIFAFTLKNEQGEQESWHIDLKETGTVGKGLAPEGKKPGGKFPFSMTCSMASG
jgi:predicted phage gp36 major capsid-like protein